MRAVTRYRGQNLSFAHPDHLCFDRTTYDNINGPGGPFMLDIVGPAGPLMYPDQISRDRLHRPCSGPSWFYRVGKRPPVKADLAIYSPVSGVSV